MSVNMMLLAKRKEIAGLKWWFLKKKAEKENN